MLGGDFIVKNLKMNKVTVIAQEIGVQPVLSFGNSTGDASMAQYTTIDNPYLSLAFMLCCDDTQRENGNEAKADKMLSLCEQFGWVPVSMKNDWTTIYGENVRYLGAKAELVTTIAEVNGHGNVTLAADPAQMDEEGFEAGDVISVTIGDESWQMPYGTQYSDVDPGEMVLRRKSDALILAVNQDSFAKAAGLSAENTGDEAVIRVEEKAGYLEEYKARNMSYSNDRADYDDDAVFANFREIVMGQIPAGVLYRSASGIEPGHNRPDYVNALCEEYGIKTVLDLARTLQDIEEHSEGDSYYLRLFRDSHVIANGNPGFNMREQSFMDCVAQDLRELLTKEAPYVIQCDEGKDRTGKVCAILEALMGASYEEMLEDYMLSYRNYYGLTEEDTAYRVILEGNAANLFQSLSGTENAADMEQADYASAAEQYLLSAGLSAEEIGQLKLCLSAQ